MHATLRKTLQLTMLLATFATAPLTTDAQNHSKSDAALLEIGSPIKVFPARASAEVKVVSYNIRWRGGDELRELIQLLKHDQEIGGAQIIGLQEVDRDRKRTGNVNTVKLIAEELGQHYAWTAPPATKPGEEEETGVAILSSYPVSDVRRIVLAHEGPGGRRRVAIGVTITVDGRALRVYSVHSETRISVEKKIEQLRTVLQDLAGYPQAMPAVVLGDFNSWEPDAVKKVSRLFLDEKFINPFPNDRETFLRRILDVPISLKLDWIWLRGLQATSYGIDEKICLSDHWPLWVVVKAKPALQQ